MVNLSALPDVTPVYRLDRTEVNECVLVSGHEGALFQQEEDGVFTDDAGILWLTGWLDGCHVKRRYDYVTFV